jgi:uncharacterized protein (TIGR03066 family)
MRRTMCAALAGLVLLWAAAATAASIEGRWKVVAVEQAGKREPAPPADKGTMIVEFAKGGKFIASVVGPQKTRKNEGTWKVDGNAVTTVVRGKTQSLKIELKGAKLKLTDTKHPDRAMFLERAK